MKHWVVTGTSMVVEADTEEEAVDRAQETSGWQWEAQEWVTDMRVHFQPQAWINDYAISVDDQGPDVWNVSDETKKAVVAALEADGGVDLDFARDDEFAPRWVRDWSGPFEITVVENT